MSVVDFDQHAQIVASRVIGPLLHGELDGLLAPLSQDERHDVRDMLDHIARQLAARAETARSMRTRLDAVIASLIGVADAIDGDCEIEPNLTGSPSPGVPDECEDACEDEG